ncbi:histidine phosphatase family protein [Acidothermaceae bacterium B102]|nr:histidine phosphatase family protein [Acidothermaceae bacterium B102]
MSGRTLVLLRHAKSDWDGEEADIDRPLARRGRREAPVAGRWLNTNLPALDLAVVSPAVRARVTWALVVDELDPPPSVTIDDRVYAASVDDLLTVVRGLPAEARTVLLVGHNPGLEELAYVLTGGVVPMPTSAIAVLDVPDDWSASSRATLRTSGRPPVG